MKKYSILIAICVLFVLSFSQITVAATVDLNPLSVTQPAGSNWCWAACDRSIIHKYTNQAISMTKIVAWVHTGNENGTAPFNRGATIDETKSALTNWGVTSSRWFDPLSWIAVKSQVNNDHLMIAFHSQPGSSMGHAILLCGWSDTWPYGDRVRVMDPKDGVKRWVQYSDLSSGTYYSSSNPWTWDGSIFSCQ